MYRQMSMGNGRHSPPPCSRIKTQPSRHSRRAPQHRRVDLPPWRFAQQNAAANTAAAQQGAAARWLRSARKNSWRHGGYQQGLQGMANTAGNIANTATNMRGQDYAAAGLQNQSRSVSQQGEIAQRGNSEANPASAQRCAATQWEANRMGVYSASSSRQLQQRALETGRGSLRSIRGATFRPNQRNGGSGDGRRRPRRRPYARGPGGAAAGYAVRPPAVLFRAPAGAVTLIQAASSDNPYSGHETQDEHLQPCGCGRCPTAPTSLERSQAAMYGAPQAAGGEMSRRADGLAAPNAFGVRRGRHRCSVHSKT